MRESEWGRKEANDGRTVVNDDWKANGGRGA